MLNACSSHLDPKATSAVKTKIVMFGMFAVARAELRRLHASSGTTGKPTVVGYTADDLACWTELMARSLACAGVLPGDIVHNAYGYGLFTGGLGVHYGAERLGCTVVPISGGGTERQVTLLNDFVPTTTAPTTNRTIASARKIQPRRRGVRPRSRVGCGACGGGP